VREWLLDPTTTNKYTILSNICSCLLLLASLRPRELEKCTCGWLTPRPQINILYVQIRSNTPTPPPYGQPWTSKARAVHVWLLDPHSYKYIYYTFKHAHYAFKYAHSSFWPASGLKLVECTCTTTNTYIILSNTLTPSPSGQPQASRARAV